MANQLTLENGNKITLPHLVRTHRLGDTHSYRAMIIGVSESRKTITIRKCSIKYLVDGSEKISYPDSRCFPNTINTAKFVAGRYSYGSKSSKVSVYMMDEEND